MSDRQQICVIGAGPVGALLSILLAQRGFGVTIYERRSDLRHTEVPAGRSINLALANRGINALQKVGLMDEVLKHLIPMRGRMIHEIDGNTTLQPYGQKPHEVIHSVSRGELNKILLNKAESVGVQIEFNQRCKSVDLATRQFCVVDELSGELNEIVYDAIIGADGGGSTLRTAISRATNGEVTEDILRHGYKELTIAPGATGEFLMDKHALHIWPRGGYMLIALPNPDGSFTATLFLPNDGNDSFASLKTANDVEKFFKRNFPDAVPMLSDLGASYFDNPTGLLGTIRCMPWRYKGNALLIGDAAHAIVPFHGQGMNAGFEDCIALDECIARHSADRASAFEEFERVRKPNADAIADMALENYIEMRDSVRDAKFILKKELAFKLEYMFPDNFIPRYSMVMFHLLPYAEAYRRGRIQEEILDELTGTASTIADIDLQNAGRLIRQRGL